MSEQSNSLHHFDLIRQVISAYKTDVFIQLPNAITHILRSSLFSIKTILQSRLRQQQSQRRGEAVAELLNKSRSQAMYLYDIHNEAAGDRAVCCGEK